MNRVLVVDDSKDTRYVLSSYLKYHGFDIKCAADATEAVKLAKEFRPTLVLLDVMMPLMSGTELIPILKEIDENVIIIMLTGYGNIQNAVDSIKAGADEYLEKISDLSKLLETVQFYSSQQEIVENNAVLSVRSNINILKVESLKKSQEVDTSIRIRRALALSGGNKTKAARRLKISRMTLYRRLEKLKKEVNHEKQV